MQILVVVANIQMRILKANAEKGSLWTLIGQGLVDPKNSESSYKWMQAFYSKGLVVKIQLQFEYASIGIETLGPLKSVLLVVFCYH